MVKLIFTSGPLEGKKFALDHMTTLGRGESNDLVLEDPAVSVVHCQISCEGEKSFVKDLGSTNGIEVNGRRVIGSDLHDGDCLGVGKSRIRVEMADTGSRHDVETVFAPVEMTQKTGAKSKDAKPSDGDELSGNIFGTVTYFLKRKIASGGMGSIYEAEQFGAEGFIKKVAIKTILPSYAENDSFVASFVGEAKLVANLVHQNIVQIHHLGRHENGYYISMEYIDGVNLTDFMNLHHAQRKLVPVEIATFIASRICRGLEYAHSKRDDDGKLLGLVHRDVSPNNIMITHEGEVKLTDFGVAKAARFMEDDDDYLVGSVEYMSPEQADCAAVDGRSDLFSLGLVFYELLTGIRVFQCRDHDIDETLSRVMSANIPDPLEYRDLPESVVKILLRCLEKDPDERHQTASELGYILEHEMYSKGYGPTIVTLAKYITDLSEKDS